MRDNRNDNMMLLVGRGHDSSTASTRRKRLLRKYRLPFLLTLGLLVIITIIIVVAVVDTHMKKHSNTNSDSLTPPPPPISNNNNNINTIDDDNNNNNNKDRSRVSGADSGISNVKADQLDELTATVSTNITTINDSPAIVIPNDSYYEGGRMHKLYVSSRSRSQSVDVYTPSSYQHYNNNLNDGSDGDNGMPLVVMLHGLGGSGPGAARTQGLNAASEDLGFVYVAPTAVNRGMHVYLERDSITSLLIYLQ